MRSTLMVLMSIVLVSVFANAQETVTPGAETRTNNTNEIVRYEQETEQRSETAKEGPASLMPTPTPTPAINTVQDPVYTRPDFDTRFSRYKKNMFGPSAFIGPAFGASIGTISNSPPEWGKTGKGFAKRYASGFGKNLIKETTVFGLDEAFRLDSHYYRSTKTGFGSRLKHAVVSSFTAKNKRGNTVIGFPRIVGIYTAEIISVKAWYPDRYTYKDGLRQATFSVGTNIFNNLMKEFIFR